MATLGHYVHHKWTNYQLYGITQKTKKGSSVNARGIFERQKNELMAKASIKKRSANIQDLEDALNAMIYPIKTGSDGSLNTRMQIFLENSISEMLGTWVMQWEGLGAKGTAINPNSYKFGATKGYALRNTTALKQQIQNAMQHLVTDPNEQLLQKFNHILSLIAQAENVSQDYINKNSKYKDFVSYKLMSTADKNKYSNIINQLNEALASISGASWSNTIGTAFEHAIATLDDRLQGAIDNTAIQLLKDTVVTGNKTGTITYTGLDTHMKNLQSTFSEAGDNSSISIKTHGNTATQQATFKTDVDLTYNQEAFKISAKNYNLKNDPRISMVSDTPLLMALMKNVDNDFINHALNILTANEGNSNQKALKQIAYQTINKILIIEAIAGTGFKGKGTSDTLVINNRSAKTVKVISIGDLLSPAMEQAYKINGLDTLITKGQEYNEWQGDKPNWKLGKRRIETLLIKLRQQKIKVSLDTNKAKIF